MRCSVAATLVWLTASASCLGQKAGTLQIKVSKNTLEATATLYGTTWNIGEGSTSVRSSDPNLKVLSPVRYTIKGDARQKTLEAVIGYTVPSGAEPASDLTLTGVKDARGGTAIVFKGQVPAFQAPPATVAGSGMSSATQTPTEQEATAENAADPPQPDKRVDANQQNAASGFLPVTWRDWLLLGDTSALGLLLIIGIPLLTGRLRRATAMEQLPATTLEPDLGPLVQQAKSEAERALTQAAEAKKEALVAQEEGDEISKRLKNLQKEVAVLRELRLDAVVAERKENLLLLARTLDELPLETSAPAHSVLSPAHREEAAAAAIVNRWLGKGGKDRGLLLFLASELEIAAELRNHGNLNPVFEDLTIFEYPFAPDPDGPWLWVPIAGTHEFWAAPADAAFFGMGRAPSLLERLFEGMGGANRGFQFQTIYKPCRMRPVAGKAGLYTVVSKGLLWLEGVSAPTAPASKDFDSLIPKKIPVMEQATTAANPVKRVAGWIKATSRQLREQQKAIESATAAQKAATRDFVARREFKQQLDDVKQQLTSVKTNLRAVAPVAQPPAAEASEESTARSSEAQPMVPQTEPDVVAGGSGRESGLIAEGWREALQSASEEPGSAPEISGVPPEEVYVQRVRNLAAELQKLDLAGGVALVHLKRDQVHETFEVHETEASRNNPHEVVCTSCGTAHTWQLAVCLGARSGEIAILYPLGGMSKSKYLSGYTGLIADLPMAAFTINGIDEPARLRPTGEGPGTYMVARKMRLAPAASGEAAR